MAQRISASNNWYNLMNGGRDGGVWNAYLHSEAIDLVEQSADERFVQFNVLIRVVEVVRLFVLCDKR
jgi:hypothetical protein